MKKVLTIAGSDPSGGAGIQADLKTMTMHGVFGMSVITALTAQNTKGVQGVFDVPPNFVAQQLDSVFADIVPDAIKIGMVSNTDIIDVIVEKLKKYKAKNIVVDPVMVSTSGDNLLSTDAMDVIIKKLIPIADIITPNLHEAEKLTQNTILDMDQMVIAAKKISVMLKGAVLIKGGHLKDRADDLLYYDDIVWIKGDRIENPNTHGTGCTLSSAIACNLANGLSILDSCINAKEYITGALKSNLDLGGGSGPLNHMWQNFKE